MLLTFLYSVQEEDKLIYSRFFMSKNFLSSICQYKSVLIGQEENESYLLF